jgi:hypothetical protein
VACEGGDSAASHHLQDWRHIGTTSSARAAVSRVNHDALNTLWRGAVLLRVSVGNVKGEPQLQLQAWYTGDGGGEGQDQEQYLLTIPVEIRCALGQLQPAPSSPA